MIIQQIGSFSLLIGQIAFLFLTLFFVYGLLKKITGRAALLASLLTLLWLLAMSRSGMRSTTHLLELFAYLAWILLLARILGISMTSYRDGAKAWAFWLTSSAGIIAVLSLLREIAGLGFQWTTVAFPGPIYSKLAMSLIGLVMLEQVARNTRRDYNWNLKFIGIGLGVIFLYAFVIYSDAALFRTLNINLLLLQPSIFALSVPFIAIASLRNKRNRMNINVSRQFVFRSGVLIAAGIYLLVMGLAGYYVRFFGGEWGKVLQVFIISCSLIFFAVVATSSKIRRYFRVVLLRNLYEYKYDYRDEWMRVTQDLSSTDPDDSIASCSIRALGDIVHSNSGAFWRRSEANSFVPVAQLKTERTDILTPDVSDSLIRFCEERDWIIDLKEYHATPESYLGLNLEPDFSDMPEAHFIVPLMIESRLFGIIVLMQSELSVKLIWEDYDILKIIARQVAGFLAMQHADQMLSDSRQLHAMNQLSAFLVHDLKTISAQLSLLLRNAEKHKDNPQFISDMLGTTENSVARMNHMLNQLKEQTLSAVDESKQVDLIALIIKQIKVSNGQRPLPELRCSLHSVRIIANGERLGAAIGHMVQNAQDATPNEGQISLTLNANKEWAILAIEDTGSGMDPEFIESKLFSPFISTKGLAGMGIGVYQTREYVRSIGGDVTVSSRVGEGTTFLIRIPLSEAEAEQ